MSTRHERGQPFKECPGGDIDNLSLSLFLHLRIHNLAA